MTSLETLILTAFVLIAIFAAVPAIMWQIYQYQALAEARAAVAFLNVLADSIESDMGAAYAQKIVNMPQLRFGELTYSTTTLGQCNGAPVYNTTLTYKSPYLYLFGLYRGTRWRSLVDAPEPPIAINGWGTSVSLAPRIVRYGNIAVVLNITYTASQGALGVGIYYAVYSPKTYSADQCNFNTGDTSTVVVIPVVIELR